MRSFIFPNTKIILQTLYVIKLSELQSFKIGEDFVCYDFRKALNSNVRYAQNIKIPHNFGSGQYFLTKLSGCVHLT